MTAPPDHNPIGHPCELCGRSAFVHRVRHQAKGDPCADCGLPAYRHVKRSKEYLARKQDKSRESIFLGLDGEGQGRAPHRYVLLQAAEESGERAWYVEDMNGLSSERCLDFIINLPTRRTSTFGFALGYDWTKILEDLPNEDIYELFRPELRARRGEHAGNRPIHWRGYTIDLMGGRMTIAKGDRSITIWDIFRFYGTKFVKALQAWSVGSKTLWERMQAMKEKRAEFDKLNRDEVREYCREECVCMAQLARKLVDAHEAVQLKLRSFHGAGSSGGAMLTAMGIKEKIRPTPNAMIKPVAMAFFGGRFENSVVGVIEGPVFNFDISSAYPYQLCWLPCLEHGQWEWTEERTKFDAATHALVYYGLADNDGIRDWGPFPFRTIDGSICYPSYSGGGYVWQDEFRSGERLFPSSIVFRGAWVYHRECDCQPFKRMPEFYRERVRLGKEGPGIVLKLGANSCYGKIAQSVGNAVFNSWIWAGLITSGTRAQSLDVLALHQDRANLLMVATDGIYTREDIQCPKPRDTGTWELIDSEAEYAKRLLKNPNADRMVRKPLGGWERKVVPQGVFCARPGIYFPLNPTKDEIDDVRGRGVGKGVVLEYHRLIVECYQREGITAVAKLASVSRFCGAKSSIRRVGPKGGPYQYIRADGKGSGQKAQEGHLMPIYGDWITRPVDMTFTPMPKRAGVAPDGQRLTLRRLPGNVESAVYRKALLSNEARQMLAATQELLEQPDVDFTEYELDTLE